jgi:hypothetical protein
MSSAAKQVQSVKEVLTDSVKNRVGSRTQQKQEEANSAFADIGSNTFYSIMFSSNSTPEEKKEQVSKALAFSGTKEEMRARIKEFENFKEYLQSVREQMATKIIELTNTETFSELQQVYKDLNGALIDFNEKMKPLTDITDALFTLRTNGLTQDAFKEILEDRKTEEEFNTNYDNLEAKILETQRNITRIEQDNAILSEQKSFFGLGNIKQSARESIARNNHTLQNLQRQLAEQRSQRDILVQQYESRKSELGEHVELKFKLRELLDISSTEHIERQKELVGAALHFVKTAKDRTSSVRTHLDKMINQVEGLGDANSSMAQVYAVLNEAVKDAEKKNQEVRTGLLPQDGVEEDMITKMRREDAKQALEQHITTLDQSAMDTMQTYADLTTQSIRIRNMRDATQTQVDKARMMHSSGIAGVADRLSVVLQAVSSAALGESSAMAKDTLAEMARSTNTVAQKESIRIALGREEVNSDLERIMDDLASYSEVQREATDITRNAVAEMRSNLEELERIARGVENDVKDSIAVNADVALGVKKQTTTTAKTNNPFNIGG